VAVLVVLAAVAGIAIGFWAGFAAGSRVSHLRSWVYWTLNLVALAVGLAVDVAGLSMGSLAAATFGIGLFAGAISGLKYGYGRVLGPWKAADALFGAAAGVPGARPGAPARPTDLDVPRDEPGLVTSPLGRDRDPHPGGGES
jgi:hypothetical protein